MRTQPSRCKSLQQSTLGAEAESPTRIELVAAWTEAYGQPPPKGIGNRLLGLAAAYHAQSNSEGGLHPDTRKRLLGYASPGNGTLVATTSTIRSGMRFVREWRGEKHIVDVLDDGILYRGEMFRSLSKVASHITGARWSGPRFFGVTGK